MSNENEQRNKFCEILLKMAEDSLKRARSHYEVILKVNDSVLNNLLKEHELDPLESVLRLENLVKELRAVRAKL